MIRISFHLLICLTWTWFRDTEFSLMTEDKGILSDIVSVWIPRLVTSTFSGFFFFLRA